MNKMDIFQIPRRKLKQRISRENKTHQSEIYIRMVLPAGQTTAIAKSMLKRQHNKPTVTLIDRELERMKEARGNPKRKRSRQESASGKKTKKSSGGAPSVGKRKKTEQASSESESGIAVIGEVLK